MINNSGLAKELSERLDGEVLFDDMSRALYSTDASIYQITPIGVVIPRHSEDVIMAIELASSAGVPILPRGGGTSLGGQAIGEALIIDFSKHMNRVLEVDSDARWARVQPGVVVDELNYKIQPSGLQYPIDQSTSDRACIGGTIGNNSSGVHSIIYGRALDQMHGLKVVFSDGSTTTLRGMSPNTLAEKCRENTVEGQACRAVWEAANTHRNEIDKRYPKIMRRVSGYNLDAFVPDSNFPQAPLRVKDERFNLARIVCGSEGTLCIATEAIVNLVPKPTMTALDVLQFDDQIAALAAVPDVIECEPSAIELTDGFLLGLTRNNPNLARKRSFIRGEPGAILAVEFYGESPDELLGKIQQLESHLKHRGVRCKAVRCIEPNEQADVWAVRKAGLGLLMGVKGDEKPVGFVEDTGVPPERLADFMRSFIKLLDKNKTRAGFYGHASVGVIHVRPILNLKRGEGVKRLRSIAEGVCELAREFGGAVTAEHGDGLVRSEFIESMLGKTLYRAFGTIKGAFDPDNLMNPGKIVNPLPMDENLRYGPNYRTQAIQTEFDYSRDGGFDRAVEMCSGIGSCRKNTGGTMCPSYRATLAEEHSPRGRANALREAISSAMPSNSITNPELYKVLDLCLECKACKTECPSNVDVAKLKYEFLMQYYKEHGLPLRSKFFANVAALGKIGSRLAPASNWILNNTFNRFILEKFLGIDVRRPLPLFARETFSEWFRRHPQKGLDHDAPVVVLLADTFTNFNEPYIGKAAVKVLNSAGFRVLVPALKCCGRPMISKGMLSEAKELARQNVVVLSEYAKNDVPILGLEPSCVSTFIDDYRDLLPTEQTEEVARKVIMFDNFCGDNLRIGKKSNSSVNGRRALVHGHCHQKALIGTDGTLSAVRLAGFQAEEIESGCCGMAGSFGYEKEHYDLSLQIGELGLFQRVRDAKKNVEIIASGTSCRHQIVHATGRLARHPAEVLAETDFFERSGGV